MARASPIIDELFDFANSSRKLRVRIYRPEPLERDIWTCRQTLGPPFGRDRDTRGQGPLQSLVLAVGRVASILYASGTWREGRLGWRGELGGYLGVAAPTTYLDFAPFLFDLRDGDVEMVEIPGSGDPPDDELIAEETFAAFEPRHPFGVRIFRPEPRDGSWACRVQIDSPIGTDAYAIGRSGLEALWRALCLIGRELYGHPLWRAGRLSTLEESGGYLGVQAPTSLLCIAPHPF